MFVKRILRKGKIVNGRFIEESPREAKWRKMYNYARRTHNLYPTKCKCPQCQGKMGISNMDEEYTYYLCYGCWKKFRRKE